MIKNKFYLFLIFIFVGLLAILFYVKEDLLSQYNSERLNRNVGIVSDWEDVRFFSDYLPGNMDRVLSGLKEIPVQAIGVPSDLLMEDEKRLRDFGFRLIWKLDDNLVWERFRLRFQNEDGVLLTSEKHIDRPFYSQALIKLLLEKNGFVPLIELSSIKGSMSFFRSIAQESVIKAHVLGTRELRSQNVPLWSRRLIRAVVERGVRILFIRFSPALSAGENMVFQKKITQELREKNFSIGFPVKSSGSVDMNSPHVSSRLFFMFLLSVAIPVIAIASSGHIKHSLPFLPFITITFITLMGGICIYGLGSVSQITSGLYPLRGVKAQLILPLLFSLLFLLSKEEIFSLWNDSIKIKHVICLGLGFGGVLFLYLTRSGNSSLIPVSLTERELRDYLEALLGARPRWKEFLLGHPFFILGLFAQTHWKKTKNFFWDGRLFLLLGCIGQISIINTFNHVHTPLQLGLLRSVHGVWMGIVLSWPLCFMYLSLIEKNKMSKKTL